MNSQHPLPHYNYPKTNPYFEGLNIHQRLTKIENKLDTLIRLLEYNNRLLHDIHQNNINMTSTNGSSGGAIIVRM